MSKYDVSRFRNVTVALNTPFDQNGELDLAATKKVVRYFCNKGVKSLYVCGSTGEGFLLDNDERKKVVETVMEEVGNEMNIIVHVGTPSTKHACELAKHAEEAGAHATSAVPCVYYRLGEESVFQHWTEITKAADLPFFIYNIPQLTGFNLSMNLFNRMLENERVAGVKNSSEPCHDILRFKQAGGEDFLVFNGPDEQYLAGRIMGADAGIGGTYGAMPELYLKIEELIRRGELAKAQDLQNNIGAPRLPFLPVSHEDPALVALFNDIKKTIEETKNW